MSKLYICLTRNSVSHANPLSSITAARLPPVATPPKSDIPPPTSAQEVPSTLAASPSPTIIPTVRRPTGGVIAGGVVGGLLFIAILAFLVFWFILRRRPKKVKRLDLTASGDPQHMANAYTGNSGFVAPNGQSNPAMPIRAMPNSSSPRSSPQSVMTAPSHHRQWSSVRPPSPHTTFEIR